MDVLITDANELRRVTPVLLGTYLGVQGWVRQETWKDRIVVWSKDTGHATLEVLVPLREQSDAYAVRLSEAVATLAQLESRSQLEVYYDMVGAGADVIRLRPISAYERQSWSLSDSADLLGGVKDLLQAAARAAENPGRPVYHGRPSSMVQDYIRELRPLPGYEWNQGLTVHSPVPANYGTQTDFGDPFMQPFPRRVTNYLNDSLAELSKTSEAIIGGEDIESIEKVAIQGVSANLCEAVAALARQCGGLQVNLAWAPVRPAAVAGGHFSFAESVADVLGQGADFLRQKHPILGILIQGEIVRLDRQSKEEFDGDSVVLAEVDGKNVALEVQFKRDDCDRVLRAFREKRAIRVSGNIHRQGRRHILRDPTDFVIIE